jgi:hypothetical protein
MSEIKQTLKTIAESGFGRCDRTFKDLTEKEIEWRPVPESNNIRWILTHLSEEWNIGLPRMIKGDPNYKPTGWPDNYANSNPSLQKLLSDLEKGKAAVLSGLDSLRPEDLDAEIDLGRGKRKRLPMLVTYLLEAVHHEGQIAALRGDITRRREKDKSFLV